MKPSFKPRAGAPVRIDGLRFKLGALRQEPFYGYLYAIGQHAPRDLTQSEYEALAWDEELGAWRLDDLALESPAPA